MNNLILDALEQTAARLPEKIAFADEQTEVSFSALVRRAQSVAAALIPLVPPRSVVGFYMDKGVETVVGFMGAVYAGCAYAQLNLRHPAPRVRAMLETLDTPIVVTDRAHLAQLEGIEPPARILLIEELEETPPDAPALAAVRAQMIDADPLYVNFTSGSTGTPKGVVVCHRNVCEFIPCFAETFAITEKDVLANQAPFDFDVSVKDIYSGLFTGARVEIVPTAYFTNPTKLMDFLCDRGVTLMVWAVSALCFLTTMNALAYKTPTTLRAILFSGEVMPIKHLHKLQKYLPDVQYVNLYGPTEITCNCTYYVVDREFAENESKTSASCCSRRTAARPSSPAKSASSASAAPPSRWATIKTRSAPPPASPKTRSTMPISSRSIAPATSCGSTSAAKWSMSPERISRSSTWGTASS